MTDTASVLSPCQTRSLRVPVVLPHAAGEVAVTEWLPEGESPERATGAAPVLLFHDSLGCIALWRGLPEALARATGRRVIAYDRLGFGQADRRTDTVGGDFVLEEAGVVVPQLRAALGIGRFVAMGHSVGGGMAVCTAARHPDCSGLISIAAQAYNDDRIRDGVAAAKAAFAEPGAVERLARYHGDRAAWVLSAWVDTWLSAGFADWSLRPLLAAVRCPALVIHGGDDEYGSPDHARTIGGGVSGPAETLVMPGHGHMPHREDEAGVLARITAFLAAVP